MNQSYFLKSNYSSQKEHYKLILVWSSPDTFETAIFGFGHEPFVRFGCEVSQCIIFEQAVASTSFIPFEKFDAIIIHISSIWLSELPNFPRSNFQRFIFLSLIFVDCKILTFRIVKKV